MNKNNHSSSPRRFVESMRLYGHYACPIDLVMKQFIDGHHCRFRITVIDNNLNKEGHDPIITAAYDLYLDKLIDFLPLNKDRVVSLEQLNSENQSASSVGKKTT
jgi:hypothetical protein